MSQFKVRSAFPLIHSKRSKDMYSTKCNVEIRLVSLGYVMALSLPLFILIYVVLSWAHTTDHMQISWTLPLILCWHYELYESLSTVIWVMGVMLAVTNVERLETPIYINANVPKNIVQCLLGCRCSFCSWKFPIRFHVEVVLCTQLDHILIHL